MNPRLFAFLILALVLTFGGPTAQHAAIRATVWQCVRSILRSFGIH